jgi:hypothetical protein
MHQLKYFGRPKVILESKSFSFCNRSLKLKLWTPERHYLGCTN